MKNQFYAVLSRMKLINRWGLMRNTRNENIAEHSLDTAIIAHSLAIIKNKFYGGNLDPQKAAVFGIFHDTTEILTGDLPTPVKYFNPEIRDAYKQVEATAEKKLLSMLPEEISGEYENLFSPNENCTEEEIYLWKIVKAADKISALIKCIEERRMGNSDFLSAEVSTLNSIKSLKMDEVDYFLDNFLSSYSNTLDEQA